MGYDTKEKQTHELPVSNLALLAKDYKKICFCLPGKVKKNKTNQN
jgi:hypothetical protein